MEKHCRWCDQTKLISDFYKHPAMHDGHLNKCKECQKQNTSAARARNPEYYKQYDKDRANLPHRVESRRNYATSEGGIKSQNKAKKEWEIRNKSKKAANVLLGLAVARGDVIKHPCFVCGSTYRIHGHHPNYDFPLDVIWLCPKHHKETHKISGELNGTNRY